MVSLTQLQFAIITVLVSLSGLFSTIILAREHNSLFIVSLIVLMFVMPFTFSAVLNYNDVRRGRAVPNPRWYKEYISPSAKRMPEHSAEIQEWVDAKQAEVERDRNIVKFSGPQVSHKRNLI